MSMNAATQFLDQFRKADAAGAPLSAFVDDPDGWGAALANEPDALNHAFAAALGKGHGVPVTLNEDGFASAACDRHGGLVVAGPRFVDWFAGIDPLMAAVRDIGPGRPRVSLFADDRTGRPVALAAGTEAVSRHWPIDARVRAALANGTASHAVIAFRPGERSWDQAALAFRLTAAEAALVAALGKHGDLQRAAAERGIAYETARKFVASAMRKTGAKRQTELLRHTLTVAAGDVGDSEELVRLIRDLFGLSERQARLAILVARGATREESAAAIGISEHRAKSDLKAVFVSCGVASAVDLSRIVAEINALEGLATACEVTIVPRGHHGEPLRLVPRTWAQGRIAVADHGPVSGAPVLIFHSNVSGRHHPRSFIAALHRAGYRPIAIERAGYGLTDFVSGDLVEGAVRDVHDVLDALDIDSAPVIARCNTASVVACAAEAYGRVTGGVLLWPEAPRPEGRAETRMTDRARAVFERYPAIAQAFARLVSRRLTAAAAESMWRRASQGIDVDLALLGDERECADIVRGAQQAALGVQGFLGEALALGTGPRPRTIADASRWTAMYGSGYEKTDVSEASAYWQTKLPGGTIAHVHHGAHFMHATHTSAVIEALDRASGLNDRQMACVA